MNYLDKKLTFEEWFNAVIGTIPTYGLSYQQMHDWFKAVWEAAQENK